MDRQAQAPGLREFEEQILPHLDDLYRAALRLTGKAPEAEDLVQETCLRAFQSLDQLKYPEAARMWVFSILRSVFLRQAERRPNQRGLVSLEGLAESLIRPSEVLRDLYENFSVGPEILKLEIREAILALPIPLREAIILAHIGGFSYREMAQILGVPMGTVMSRLFRARRRLRANLREAIQCRSRPELTR